MYLKQIGRGQKNQGTGVREVSEEAKYSADNGSTHKGTSSLGAHQLEALPVT